MGCKSCKHTDTQKGYLFDELRDYVTTEFGEEEVRFTDIRDLILSDPVRCEQVRLLARFRNVGIGNIIETIASYCNTVSLKEEYDAIVDEELVAVAGWVNPRKVSVA